MKSAAKAAAERLVIEAAQKDPSRFAQLYENNVDLVYAFVVRRVRDRDEAQDLTSEVFHQALANLRRFEWRGAPFAAWLLKIASNAVVDRWKRLSRESQAATHDHPPEVALDEIEHRARLFRLVERLPADQRRVIVMRFAQQKTIREIARNLRRTEGAIKQLQFRGLQNLRTRLGDKNG